MNERIKELALKSGFAYDPEKDNLWVSGSTELMISPGLEKFAELIIRECGEIATYPQLGDEQSYYGNEFAKAIKKHFGVE